MSIPFYGLQLYVPDMIRTFISVDVPVTGELKEAMDSLRGYENVRVVNEKQLHLTLKFLGDTDERKVERLCSALKGSLEGTDAFDLVIEGAGAFPNERNPRVVWLGVKEPGRLIEIADTVDSTVKDLKIKADDKKFSPHLTLGRINGRCDLTDYFRENKKRTFCSFRCESVNVMKSELTPKGAIHSVIETIDLQ